MHANIDIDLTGKTCTKTKYIPCEIHAAWLVETWFELLEQVLVLVLAKEKDEFWSNSKKANRKFQNV